MTAVINLKSANVTAQDAVASTGGYSGYPTLSAGEGAGGQLISVEDSVALPTTFFSATNNYARILRIPTRAKLKRLELLSDAAVDAAATTGATTFTVGLMFSDSTIDGTPSAYQGLVPSTVGLLAAAAGTVVASPGTSTYNVIFGTVTPPATTGPIPLTDVTFNGNGAAAYAATNLALVQTPLVALFNFLDGRGVVEEELGYFDVFINTTHAYTTVPTTVANLFMRAQYTVE
jgi:hypothetical protein